MIESTNTQKIKEVLKKFGKLSRTEISNKTNIHIYLIDSYLIPMEKSKEIKKESNDSGKFVWYELNKK